MNVKKYIGRQLRPTQLAAELLPSDQRWCAVCHKAVLKDRYSEHLQMTSHRLGVKKLNKLKRVSLSMWEKHRGAPLDEESANESFVEDEYRRFRMDQQRREQAALAATFREPPRW